jgi:hypothetical protein
MGSTASSTKQESCLLRQAGFHLSTDGADIGTPLGAYEQIIDKGLRDPASHNRPVSLHRK